MELEPQGKAVTSKHLAKLLNIKKGYAQKIIHDAQKISENYIVDRSYTPLERKGKRGAPLVSYHLNHARFVTRPDTAFILLTLLEYPLTHPPEEIYSINRVEFTNYLTAEYGINESVAQDRIDWAIDNSYIIASEDRMGIYYGDKISCEKDYLDLLKEVFLSQSPSTAKGDRYGYAGH
jgi:hypothetical protein